MNRFIITVEISNVQVDERYFSFHYKVTLNGALVEESHYDSDYENEFTPQGWKEYLEERYACKLAVERAFS